MKKDIGNTLLTVLIVLLTLSMLTLMVFYAASNVETSKSTESFDKLWIVQDYEETAFSVFDSSLCTPELIAYKQDGAAAGAIVSDEELSSTIYSILSDVIFDVFGNESICVSRDIDPELTASELADASSYIYFEYGADIPYPCIFALSSNENTVEMSMCANGDIAYISKLGLILQNNADGSAYYSCVAFDSHKNAYRFKHADDSPYLLESSDLIHLDAYAHEFEPAALVLNESGIGSLELVFGEISYLPIRASSGTGFLGLDDSKTSASFLELFEINPEKINSYTERDGTAVFIGTDERLTVSSDNIVRFTCSQGSLPLKKILGYTPSKKSAFSLFDMLKASDIMIDRFRLAYPEYIGKSAQIKLTGVYKDTDRDGAPVLEYSYFYNGTLIDTPTAFRFVFDSDGITEMSINLTGFTVMADKRVTLSKKTVYERVSENTDKQVRIRPLYNDSADGLYLIDWAIY